MISKDHFEDNQMKEILHAFNFFDTDGSGEISVNELSKVIKHLEFDCVDEEVREIMKLLDKNGDGKIQFHEFAVVMTSKFYKPKTTEEIIEAFKEYDVDNSGTLCVKEIEKVMKNFRGNITKSQFKELVDKADCDHNGLINISEFVDLMASLDLFTKSSKDPVNKINYVLVNDLILN